MCILLGVLWRRALARVRRNIGERAAAVRHIAQVQASLSLEEAVATMYSIVRLQANARMWLAVGKTTRLRAMEA